MHYGNTDADYLTDVVSAKGKSFIQRAAASHKPFLVEISTFAPHGPFTPARQDLDKFPGLTAPRTPAWDTLPTNAPTWLAGNGPLTAAEIQKIDIDYRKRAQAVQAVDRMIDGLRQQLVDSGVADNTYVVFSSDNGFHMGDHRLVEGKQTAFDHDVVVPLVIAGPNVPSGISRPQIVQNIDLAPHVRARGRRCGRRRRRRPLPADTGHRRADCPVAHRLTHRAPWPGRQPRRPRRPRRPQRHADHL
nr:hypothetical protein GCM10020092_094340 [Actinoplanes digitatis]